MKIVARRTGDGVHKQCEIGDAKVEAIIFTCVLPVGPSEWDQCLLYAVNQASLTQWSFLSWQCLRFRQLRTRPHFSKALISWHQFMRGCYSKVTGRNVGTVRWKRTMPTRGLLALLSSFGINGDDTGADTNTGLLLTCHWEWLLCRTRVFEHKHQDWPIWVPFEIAAKCIINMGLLIEQMSREITLHK